MRHVQYLWLNCSHLRLHRFYWVIRNLIVRFQSNVTTSRYIDWMLRRELKTALILKVVETLN